MYEQNTEHRPGAMGGHFMDVLHQITACAPKREMCPPSEDCAPKESNRPGFTGEKFETCVPPNTACAPLPQA